VFFKKRKVLDLFKVFDSVDSNTGSTAQVGEKYMHWIKSVALSLSGRIFPVLLLRGHVNTTKINTNLRKLILFALESEHGYWLAFNFLLKILKRN